MNELQKRIKSIIKRYKKAKDDNNSHGCLKIIADKFGTDSSYMSRILTGKQPWSAKIKLQIETIEDIFTELGM